MPCSMSWLRITQSLKETELKIVHLYFGPLQRFHM
jgi:hypothetical protein